MKILVSHFVNLIDSMYVHIVVINTKEKNGLSELFLLQKPLSGCVSEILNRTHFSQVNIEVELKLGFLFLNQCMLML